MSERYVSLAEVRDLLTAEGEKRELLVTQKASRDHAQAVCALSVEDAEALAKEVKVSPDITDAVAYKIADLLPQYPEDIRAILAKERLNLEPAKVEQIIQIVGKYI
ncbi:MAG: hypothetical protein RBQ77_01705 [Candidatus Methanomethylophilaceae archaeon]|jgi:DNA-directed RNA polymerase subunit F|nr:hypothetical protein [Candidatus Methanomethylophilaceae archaeon]NLF34182.1 RNA polymerase [Thermoplasmatales archaeon]